MNLITETMIAGQPYPVNPPVEAKFRNYYRCPADETVWTSDWDCQCDDKCPQCGIEVAPDKSDDLCLACNGVPTPEDWVNERCSHCGTELDVDGYEEVTVQ